MPLQVSQGSQDLPNQDSCQTLTRGNIIEYFEEDSCFSCQENLFNVSDIEDHQPPTTPEPCLKRYPTVKNRLAERIDFWESIGASNWILKILRESYALPFVKQPPKMLFQNNKSALSSAEFVTNEIKDLLKSSCIKEIDESEAHVISPLSVVHKSTKPRLILDLSYLNQFLTVPKFQFEDVRSVKVLLELGQRKHTKFYIACRLYWNSTVKSHFFFFLTQFLTHFLFCTNLRVWVFKCKLQIRVGGWGTGLIQ